MTGATGFVGSRVTRHLAERGDDLRVTVRRSSDTTPLDGLDYEEATCDLLDRRAVRRALRGVDRVFHAAGPATIGTGGRDELYRANVEATRILLEEALRAGVGRVVLTSSAAALGPAPPGSTADESQLFTAGELGIPYVNARHEAEVEALRIAAHGLDVVIVNPTLVFGSGDHRGVSTGLVRRFLLGRISVYTEGALNVVDVDDVARAHLLADTEGRTAERYIVGNRNYTLERLFADLGRLSGVDPPALKLPGELAEPFARLMEIGFGTPPITVLEARAAGLWWSYRSTKARRELGWTPAPHEDAVESTVKWYLDREGEAVARARRSQPARYRLASIALRAAEGAAGPVRGLGRRLGL